jgi:hypothetical protein
MYLFEMFVYLLIYCLFFYLFVNFPWNNICVQFCTVYHALLKVPNISAYFQFVSEAQYPINSYKGSK